MTGSAISGSAGTVKYDLIASGVDGGPFTPDAYLSHVAIVRGSLSTPKVTVVDYGAILKGKAQDILLEPGDIIYIPNSPYNQSETVREPDHQFLYRHGSRQ